MSRNETKRSEIWLACVLAVFLWLPCAVQAQQTVSVDPFTASELDTLLANIALYPDPLLVQVLTASTYGEQIGPAAAWSNAHKNLKDEALSDAIAKARLPYDPSVLALLPFPSVLSMMDRYAAWTEQLGDAVSMQRDDVLLSVQRLRRTAAKYGHLVSDANVRVSEGQNITITPVRTEYVYVPVYDPYVVYYRYYDGYGRIVYGPSIWIGGRYSTWGWGVSWFDWNTRIIYVRDTRWHSPRRHPWHARHYVAPRRHERPVGPPLGQKSSAVRYSSQQYSRPASATWADPGKSRSAQPERRTVHANPPPPPSRSDTRDDRYEKPRYDLDTPRGSTSFNRRSDRGEPVDIANGRRSSNTSTTPPPSARRDDEDSRGNSGSSRGGFGSAIRRK